MIKAAVTSAQVKKMKGGFSVQIFGTCSVLLFAADPNESGG